MTKHEHTRHDTHEGDGLSPDLMAIAAALDCLGVAERESAPADLEDRIAQATRASLIAPAPAIAGRIEPRAWSLTPLRIAAGLSLAAIVGAAYLARDAGSTANDGTVARASASDWMLMAAVWEEAGTGGVSSLVSETTSFSSLLDDSSMDWLVTEGAM
ncbi:MAG: hypothetical protein IPM33_00700 [Phycisphaerales bacterium]|nr:hypothetical protein [Phycisphaerales bacterium]